MDATFFKCLICGKTQLQQEKEHWLCLSCNTRFPVKNGIPLLVRDWDTLRKEIEQASQRLPGWYQGVQNPEENSIWKHHLAKRRVYVEEEIKEFLAQSHSGKAGKLLDIGCGDGNHLQYLKKYARQIYGSDYNLTRLERAHNKYPEATIYLADILEYPALDGFFELIFFNHVIEHIPNDHQALREIMRILKPGGLLILGTPNEGAWWWQTAYRLQPQIRARTDHVHFYTQADLTNKIRNAGLQIIDTKYLGWGVPHWSLDARLRRFKFFDDLFELLGNRLFPKQASSIYVVATKS